MNSGIKTNAWEVETEAQAILALAGHSTAEEIERDRVRRADEVARALKLTPGMNGFEIGSGNGLVARSLSERCARIDCNDISRSFLNLARETCRDAPNVRFHQIEDRYLGHLPSTAYDFGYSLNVFIHLNPYDMFNYFVDVSRILRPGGMFFFDACTLGRETRKLFLEHARDYRGDPASVRGLLCFNDPKVIADVAKEAGLRVVKRNAFSRSGWMKFLVRKIAA